MRFLRSHWKKILFILLLLLVAIAIAARLYLPVWLKGYVNQELDNLDGYSGSVQDIDVHLYRGAYTIHEMKITEDGHGIPVPFVTLDQMDISIQWSALLHGRVVAKIHMYKPVINFAVNKSGTHAQTGANVDWTQEIKKLIPIDINRLDMTEGKIFYRNFSTTPQINIFITNLNGQVTNLRNVVDKGSALPSHVAISGNSIGKGIFNLEGRMDILKRIPDMKLGTKLEHVNLTALNDYFRAFAFLDVKKGSFDFYSELTVHDGNVSGYAKPIARNIELIDLEKDSNPIKLVWESLASVVIQIFSNQRKDQFATEIPLSGRIDNVQANGWAALGGILHNAFIKAFDKGLNRTPDK